MAAPTEGNDLPPPFSIAGGAKKWFDDLSNWSARSQGAHIPDLGLGHFPKVVSSYQEWRDLHLMHQYKEGKSKGDRNELTEGRTKRKKC